MIKIKYYKNKNENYPIKDWINKFSVKLKAKILKHIYLLKHLGNKLRKPFVYKLSDDIFELRIKEPRKRIRIIRFAKLGRNFLLLRGFIKKVSSVNAFDITISDKRLNDHYLNYPSSNLKKKKRKKKKKKKKKTSDDFTKHLKEQTQDQSFNDYWKIEIKPRLILSFAVIKLRVSNRLSRKEFAEIIGTNQAEITKVENGSINTGIDIIGKIANAFSKDLKINFK